MRTVIVIALLALSSRVVAQDRSLFNPFKISNGGYGEIIKAEAKSAPILQPPQGQGWFYDSFSSSYWRYTSPAHDSIEVYPSGKILKVKPAPQASVWKPTVYYLPQQSFYQDCPTGT
jgi:hypothetical protein